MQLKWKKTLTATIYTVIYQHINTINILAPVINKNCLILMIQHRSPKIWKLVVVKCAHLKIV